MKRPVLRPRSRRSSLSLASLAALAACVTGVVAGCGGEESPYDIVENWDCFEVLAPQVGAAGAGGVSAGGGGAAGEEPEVSCDCKGLAAGQKASDTRPPVVTCDPGWLCCYSWRNADDLFDCRCEDPPADTQAAGYCAGLAANLGGDVVDTCPPTPRDDASYCAFESESCELSYLEQQGLNGCCADLVCGTDTYGKPVCVPE